MKLLKYALLIRFRKPLILLAAAVAGALFYKAQRVITAPGTDREIGGQRSLYSSVTGEGSLYQTWQGSTAQRDAAPQPNYRANPVPRYAQPSSAENARKDDFSLLDAAAKGDDAKVQDRLAAGAKVDSRDSNRRTPLMYAAWSGFDDICSRLIAAGANPEFQDRDGNNSFDYAAGRGLIDSLRFLLQRADTRDDKHYVEYAMLVQAVFAGDISKLPSGHGKLHSVNRINPEGVAPLHIAAGNGSIDLIEALVARGADINLANNSRQTPLHWAAWNNQTSAIGALIKKGADIAQPDLAGNTPLIFAAQNGSYGAVKALLDNGADRYIANKQGKIAALVAEDNGFHDLAALLK